MRTFAKTGIKDQQVRNSTLDEPPPGLEDRSFLSENEQETISAGSRILPAGSVENEDDMLGHGRQLVWSHKVYKVSLEFNIESRCSLRTYILTMQPV
jgi:hypothetical protein